MAGYESQQVGGAIEFSTIPETVPMPLAIVAIPGVLLVLIALSIHFLWGVIAAGLVYGAMYLLMHSKQATQYRAPAKFRVSPTGIEVGAATIAKDAIHRVIIRNHVLKSAESIIVVANPNQNSGQQNVVAGMNWAISKLGPISYRVDVEARGVPTTLAGGLTEPTAAAIAAERQQDTAAVLKDENRGTVTAVAPPFTAAPIIETERLRLRGHDAGDFSACAAMWSDPQVVRYTIGEPSPPQRSWLRILAYRGHWALLGFGYWAVQEKASNRYVGELGFADFKRSAKLSLGGIPELGWALIPWAQGRGYATEALQAALAWGDSHFQSPRTVCIIHRDNARSFRVAAKLGYATELQAPTDTDPNAILARDVPGHPVTLTV